MASLRRCTLNRWLNGGGKLGELLGSKDCPAAWNPEGYEKCPLGSILLNVLAQNQEKGWLSLGVCGQAETMVEGWELQRGPAASSMEIKVVTPQSLRGSPMLLHELKCFYFRLYVFNFFSFFPFRIKVLEALCKNLEGKKKSCLNPDPSV